MSGFKTDFLTFLQSIGGNTNCLNGMVVFPLMSPASLKTRFCRLGCTACPNKGCRTFTALALITITIITIIVITITRAYAISYFL